jgi:hypothetical protein
MSAGAFWPEEPVNPAPIRALIVLKDGTEHYSSETYQALTDRKRGYVHASMPVKVVRGMKSIEIDVARDFIARIEPVDE